MKAALAKRRGFVDREYDDSQLLLSLFLQRGKYTVVVDMTSCASWFVSKSNKHDLGREQVLRMPAQELVQPSPP